MSTNIVVRIIGELKDAGFIKAEKRSSALEKKFDKLGKTAKRTFLAIAGIGALKKSITAFAAEDKAIRQLTVSLGNLGLAYNVPALEAFIKQTELATGISGEQLRPAIRDLVTTTLDAEQATQLLNTALDIAAGTGASLDATVNALTRAFNGNFASLGKIQTRYTSAELEAMGFAEAIATLNGEFKGTSAAAADSYQGKIDRLGTALDDAAKIIGEDVLQALEKLADGDFDKVLSGIANAANFLGSAFNSLAFSLAYTREFLGTGLKIDASEQAKLDAIKNQFFPTANFSTSRPNPAILRNYAKQLELQKKIVKEREKAAKISEKDKKNQASLAKAKAVFDLEKIQIEAALQGKITEEERTRLLLMRAILEEDADKAEKLTAKLEKIQQQTLELAESLTTLEASDPFAKWGDYFDAAKKNIKDLFDTLTKQQMALNELMTGIATTRATANANVIAAKTDKATAFKEAAAASSVFAGLSTIDAAAAVVAAVEAVAAATTPEEKAAAKAAVDAANAYVDATTLLTESLAAADLAAALADLELANEYLNQSIEAATSQGLIPETTINVTVEGNVTSAEDLAEVITDIQYTYQRTGKGLLLSSTAI